MWFVIISMALLLLIVAGLMAAHIAANAQDKILAAQLLERKLRHSAQELLEQYPALQRYCRHPRLQGIWLDELESRLQDLQQQLPEDAELQQALALCGELQGNLSTAPQDLLAPEAFSCPQDDQEIQSMHRVLRKISRLLLKQTQLGWVSAAEQQELEHWLAIVSLRTDVAAFELQGQFCLQQDDRSGAVSYFKHAKELLLTSSLSYDQRSDDIKRISKGITGIYVSADAYAPALPDANVEP